MAEESRIRLADLTRQHAPIMAGMEAAIRRVVAYGSPARARGRKMSLLCATGHTTRPY